MINIIKKLMILAITSLTIAFHFDIRLIIENIVPKFKNKININNSYYKLKKFEEKIYSKIKVKKWKSKIPTYDPDEFNTEKNSLEEIIVNWLHIYYFTKLVKEK